MVSHTCHMVSAARPKAATQSIASPTSVSAKASSAA
jgi:hypothetical protein